MSRITDDLRRKYFGKVWEKLSDASFDMGIFLMTHDTHEVCIHKNAMRILGFSDVPTYDELSLALERTEEYAESRSPIMLDYCDVDEDDLTAGAVWLNASHSELDQGNFLLSTQAEIVRAIDASKGGSLVMILHLDGADTNPRELFYCVYSALNALFACLPPDAMIASHSNYDYWVYIPSFEGDPIAEAERLRTAVEKCALTDRTGSVISENHHMTFSAGICCGEGAAVHRMHSASFALFDAAAKGKGSLELFDPEEYERQKSDYGDLRRFSRLLDQDLFTYHFQPIVNAVTGEIFAYEALMRTDPTIGFGPLRVLELAERYDRLYDIELATLNNTLQALSENQGFFEGRKLFINSVTSHILNDEDYLKIAAKYGELLEKTVIELTEHNEIDDNQLATIRSRIKERNMQMAIDDFGTGYANSTNLVRYAPEYVKIDRALIENIDRKPSVQTLVKGIIDFCHSCGYLALAEGVETFEEVRAVIFLGIDLLQGYWVSRPKPVFVNEVAESVKDDIVRINLEAAGKIQKTRKVEDGEKLSLMELALGKYTEISIGSGSVTLTGVTDQLFKMPITIRENAECTLTLHEVSIESDSDVPAIELSEGSRLTLICEGNNLLRLGGILVPEGTVLTLSGSGSLCIDPEAHDCFGIGNDSEKSAGEIYIDTIDLTISTNGERCIGIGGGKKAFVRIGSGCIDVNCSGGICTGIGSIGGDADLFIDSCSFGVNIAAASSTCIGSISGNAVIGIANASVNCESAGSNLCGIGSLSGGRADIDLRSLEIDTVMRGKAILNIGSNGAEANCSFAHTKITLYSEGGEVTGIGDRNGGGDINVSESEMHLAFRTGNGFDIGSAHGSVSLDRIIKDIRMNE